MFPHRYVAIEGLMGAGKTSLALRLAEEVGARAVLEAVEDNPFLAEFYRDPDAYAFQTQVWFLLSRWRRQEDLRQMDLFASGVVADSLFAKDRIYAAHVLPDGEWRLYEDLYRLLAPAAVRPDLVVYLQASTDRLLEAVERHGRPFEADVPRAYLERLGAAYDRYFFHYDETPLLVAAVDDLDLADPDDFRVVYRAIESAGPGTTYFRPRRPLE